MNSAAVKELMRRRDEAQKIVDALNLILKDVPVENGKPKKTRGGENSFSKRLLEVVGASGPPLWISEIGGLLKEKHGDEVDGPTFRSALPVRVQTECSRLYKTGVLKRKKIEGKWAYYVK